MQFTMKSAMTVLAFGAGALADQCATGSTLSGGNWYCQPVKAIQYSNVGHSGSYNKVTGMSSSGVCSNTPTKYSGSLAPLDEEVSLHFRGPMRLKQVAAYSKTKTGSAKKREAAGGPHARRHAHAHDVFHKREAEPVNEKRAEWVTVTMDGKVVSWKNDWSGKATAAAGAPAAAAATTTAAAPAATSPAAGAAASAVVKAAVDPNAAYTRIGYYNAATQALDGLTFLGNHGGQGSGVFDNTYGMSLAYLNSAGTGGAASPSVLADALIPSNAEFSIFTDKPCSGSDCGFTRPGGVSYHGFDGADKVFLVEFSMPYDGNRGFNGDMPAFWLLNAQIPRTLQFGDAGCSCWTTGCGEFDVAEVLTSGDNRCKSTVHTNAPGGSSDYFVRPTIGTMKLAVIFNSADGTINIQVLPDSTDFTTSLTAAQVNAFLTAHSGADVSQFSIAA